AAELENLGVRVQTFPGWSLVDPLRAARLVGFLRRGRFDVLFTHLTSANILGSLAGRIIGVPTIATLHSIGVNLHPRFKILESWALRRAAKCSVAVGHAVAAANRERLAGARCVVIPNPAEQTAPLPPAERLAIRRELIGTNNVMLASVGMLKPAKGFGDLLAAFAALRRTHPGAALVIAGAGPLEGELRAQIDSLELNGHTHLIGLRDDVPRVLAAADIYVCSSHREGLPLSLLEAMEVGLPSVATDVGDVRSVIVDGTGLIVPPRDPTAMADALRWLFEDPQRRRTIGAAARRHVHQSYRVDKWAERLICLGMEAGGRVGRFPIADTTP
ncbi:MAG: glycosyltransferase, partial [Dehalococcoidia bacterium]